MKKSVIGILAHVDAGKTTLAEAMLYKAGSIRKLGRVDNGDTLLDTHHLERSRGITIFAGQSVFSLGDWEITLLDTPGHVDFSAETERILQVLDYAVMVISGTDGVQAHTRTLWNLLEIYNVPTFIFVTKMDYARREKADLMRELREELSDNCIDFSEDNDERFESLAMCREDVMESYLDSGEVSDDDIRDLVGGRLAFPCFFGSGLKIEGVDEFLRGMQSIIAPRIYSDAFGAKVFKITHDTNGAKVTHIKLTGGRLKIRDTVTYGDKSEKISAIRIYSGTKFTAAEEVCAGSVCAVLGLSDTKNGQGLGTEEQYDEPLLEPVMNYRIVLPSGVDAKAFLPRLRMLEEDDPLLRISWNAHLQELSVSLMGEVQVEILKSLISDRFDIDVEIDNGRVLYKETIGNTVEGVGHYEPLRHYAEVHLIMSPMPRGKGILLESKCSEDALDRNWQRLIMMHLCEKQHIGVLTSSPITDIKITLAAGRAHLKHTEGGDFRQATYRAVRQGLMQAESILLEPYYSFRLEVPSEQIGRAISDIKLRCGSISAPEERDRMAVLRGTAPVTTMNSYAAEVAAYTAGRGKLQLTVCGYDVCHNPDEVINKYIYQPESDLDNSPDSIFCAHGGGFNVKWDKVSEYMHIESCLEKKETPYEFALNRQNFHIDEKELEAIMEREFGPARLTQTLYRPTAPRRERETTSFDAPPRKKYIIVDGYNCIFAWEELKALSDGDIGAARERLADILCNYAAYTRSEVILVFDAYKVAGGKGENYNYNNIHIVYTKERELGDVYIEKLVSEIGKNENVRVVTSDGMIQLSALRFGVLRVSAAEFEAEVSGVQERIAEYLSNLRDSGERTTLGDIQKLAERQKSGRDGE
ncbi:MAG: NYN domain-containing protein [Clostridia bacterium]|nr:NYN domain-containing protein [Clostridia bacterium]